MSSFYAKNLACCCHLSFVIMSLRTSEIGGKMANVLIKKYLYGLNDYPQKINDKLTMMGN